MDVLLVLKSSAIASACPTSTTHATSGLPLHANAIHIRCILYLLQRATVNKQELDTFCCVLSQHFLRQVSVLADVSIKSWQRLLGLLISPAQQAVHVWVCSIAWGFESDTRQAQKHD